MDDRWGKARSEWDAGLVVEASRARFAIFTLVASAAVRVLDFGAKHTHSDAVLASFGLGELALLVLTAIAFLRWLAHAVSFASLMSPLRLRWSA